MSMTLVWLSLGVPTVLWWRQSVAWVAFMSLYANVVGHWSAWQATRAEENQQSNPTPDPTLEISETP